MSAASNPFRSECVTALPFVPQGQSWTQLWGELASLDWRGAIVGPCGSGKTTLLEMVASHLTECGLEPHLFRMDTRRQHLPRSFWRHVWQSRDAILLDGAEQLGWGQWQAAKWRARNAGAFILTAHRTNLLPTWIETATSPALLLDLASRLSVEMSEAEGQNLFEAHQGDLRQCFLALYDTFGAQKPPFPS